MIIPGHSVLRAAALGWLVLAGQAFAAAPFHIGICTDPSDPFAESSLGAAQLVTEYGAVKDGGYIKHVTSTKDVASMAKDPLMKAIVVCPSQEGVAEVYKKIRASRPEILLLAAQSGDEAASLQRTADLVVDVDPVSRGFAVPWGAKQLGAGSLVFLSFPRHLKIAPIARLKAVMAQACKDLDMTFAYEEVLDLKTSKEAAKAYIAEGVPKWVAKYGAGNARVAFYCTQDGLAFHVVKQVVAQEKAVFVEEDCASPLIVDAGLFEIDAKAEQFDFQAILGKIEAAVISKGASGRIGTAVRGADFAFTAGLGEFSKRILEGKGQVTSVENLCEALGKYTPGSAWRGGPERSALTGDRTKNRLMVYTDTYVFGKGFLGSTAQAVPDGYFSIKP
ncbi:MAG TPA: DUF3798 domain-containing protein [Holophaga sp.]|nr:DUF3798 domain-containing protein [Holophaga sp.]